MFGVREKWMVQLGSSAPSEGNHINDVHMEPTTGIWIIYGFLYGLYMNIWYGPYPGSIRFDFTTWRFFSVERRHMTPFCQGSFLVNTFFSSNLLVTQFSFSFLSGWPSFHLNHRFRLDSLFPIPGILMLVAQSTDLYSLLVGSPYVSLQFTLDPPISYNIHVHTFSRFPEFVS